MKTSRKRAGATPFRSILTSLMAEKKLTVRQAAELAGVSPSTLQDWRAGTLPEDYSAVMRLAHGLGVSFAFLLTGEDDAQVREHGPAVAEVFKDGGTIFDGYAKITIQRLLPRREGKV